MCPNTLTQGQYQYNQQMFPLKPIQQTQFNVNRCDILDYMKKLMFLFLKQSNTEYSNKSIGTILIMHISTNTDQGAVKQVNVFWKLQYG